MAVTPNTTFTSGQILTAAQMNAFPRGLMTDIVTATSTYNLTTSFVTQLTTASFTAVTGRLYKITYFEPTNQGSTGAGNQLTDFQIKNGATVLTIGAGAAMTTTKLFSSVTVMYVGALTAGATVITSTASATSTTGTPQLQRAATSPAFLIVEDIGAA
jgi:hypothetical protein